MQEELLASTFPIDGQIATDDDLSPPTASRMEAPHDHWEQEKEKLILVLTERLLRGRENVAFSELKKAPSPFFIDNKLTPVGEIVVAVLQNQARQIIRQEKPLVLQSKRRFELEDLEIRGQLRRLRDLLAERLVFDKNELQAAIAFAVRLQFDLLTKPGAALEQLIFSWARWQQKADIIVILAGLDEKHPVVASLQNLLADYPDGEISKEAFRALCDRAATCVYGAQPVAALIADLQAYQQFCASIGPSRSARITQQTVLRMLRERGRRELAEKAQPELTQQHWWAIAEISPVLERALTPPGVAIETPEPVSAPPVTALELSRVLQEAATQMKNLLAGAAQKEQAAQEPQIAAAPVALNLAGASETMHAEAPISANGKDENEAAVVSEEIPIQPTVAPEIANAFENAIAPARIPEPEIPPPPEIEFQEVDLKAILAVEEVAIPALPKVIYNDADAEEPLLITRAALEAQPPGPYPSITRLIDEKSRHAFIKKVFQKDLDAYLDFIENLEATQTWKEAKTLLDGTFKQRRVNPYSKEAVQLSDLVFSRYFTRGAK